MIVSITDTYQEIFPYNIKQKVIPINTFKILFYLIKRDGYAYNSEIKRYLNRSNSQVSHTMKHLKLKNYIEVKCNHPLEYKITPIGRRVYRETVKEFLKFEYKKKKKPSKSKKRIFFDKPELEEYYKDILIGFFIELPEMLADLNLNFTPQKYHEFVIGIKEYLQKYDIIL